MKIILAPAKKMNISDVDTGFSLTKPVFLEKTSQVLEWLKSKSYDELKAVWKCNDDLARLNFDRISHI